MPVPNTDISVVGSSNPVDGHVNSIPTHQEINEKGINEKLRISAGDRETSKDASVIEAKELSDVSRDDNSDDVIIVTGADVAAHLIPLRDDGDPALSFRSLVLATGLSSFQAVMFQIYSFKPTSISVQGTFIVLIAYFLGKFWANLLPRGDKYEARWREKGGQGTPPLWIRIISFFNYGPWNLKEHAICAITATSASNAAATVTVFAAQDLFYDIPLSATTVILSVISVGLFGYGLCGILRPIMVWHPESVYWGTLPTVKSLQALHWQDIKSSQPLRYFWYAFGSMFTYEFFPAYIFPWLNSVSIPCLAASKATGSKAAVLTNLFGGATNNEGLGLFTLSFDWQYITSFSTSLPLKLQLHTIAGYFVCVFAMLGIYYTNTWDSKAQPFMSTQLRSQSGSRYPIAKVFSDGILNNTALEEYGSPTLTGSFAYSMLMANAAIGALVTHTCVFWGGDVVRTFKSSREGVFADPHHAYMAKTYKDAPWWWFVATLAISFFLGLIVVLKENITLPAWAYIVALLVGCFIAPLSNILYARFGNGIATNNLSKMLAGLMLPGRPVGNMYFAAWSHNIINNTVNLSGDLKMGEYLKIPPRVMFLTQVYGTILGGFINYVVMISIVNGNRELLTTGNGNSSWSGANIQAFNTNAASWALATELYTTGAKFAIVPLGMIIGAAFVIAHRIIIIFIPKIRNFQLTEINMPQFLQYAGMIPYNQSQTCVILTQIIAGLFTQLYLRNYRPNFFKNYSYLITGAWDGASLTVLFILSFAVFGAAGVAKPFPTWWGNNVDGNYDHCPVPE
ncbi:hypothetical protein DSL72_001830 [Monilinia vaccinii-corymbosi]|uniref:OPT family small oligopeptide transporter n=1 Tax=Monilinia vaccinii-corymbosi TaxID=61207 RepID=A0A8A3PAY4_9HELO|nr:hypothetical protein DSL72_001830 [Monilinia vaccinii-corymbosi]